MNNFQKALNDWQDFFGHKPFWCTILFIIAGLFGCFLMLVAAILFVAMMEITTTTLGLSGFSYFFFVVFCYIILFFMLTVFGHFIEPYIEKAKKNKHWLAFYDWFDMGGEK